MTSVELDGPATTLGDLLRREHVLEDAALKRCVLSPLRSERLLGEVLVDQAGVSEQLVEQLLRQQISMRIRVLETLTDAVVRFRAAVRPPRSAFVKVSIGDYLVGRKRQRSEEETPVPPSVGAYASSKQAIDPQVAEKIVARERALSELGLPANAPLIDARRAYQKLVHALHPDTQSVHTDPETTTAKTLRLMKVREAYRTLISS